MTEINKTFANKIEEIFLKIYSANILTKLRPKKLPQLKLPQAKLPQAKLPQAKLPQLKLP